MKLMKTVLFVLLVGCVIVGTVLLYARIHRMRQSDVTKMEAAYIGQSGAQVTKVHRILITNHSNPLMKLNKRPVWEVVADKVEFENKTIHRLSILIDEQTGALLEVFSPKQKTDGIAILNGTLLHSELTIQPTTIIPKMSLLQVLNSGELSVRVSEAKEIIAFYGLVTDNLNPKDTELKKVPCWVVFVGGVKSPLSGGPCPMNGGPHHGPVYASEEYGIVNANTGKFLRGGGVGHI